MSRPRVIGAALLVSLAGACIGRPIVGYRDPDEAQQTGLCEDDGLNCSDFGEARAYEQPDVAVFSVAEPCSDEVITHSATGTEVLADLDLRCSTLELTVAHGAVVTLSRPRIDHARILLIAEGAATVTILAATGRGGSIAVEGMSSLQLQSLSEVTDLRVDATSRALGWDVTLEDSFVDGLAVRTGPDAKLALRGSQLRDGVFEGGRVQLRSLTLRDSMLDAKSLDSSGTDIADTDLRARRGNFIAGSLRNVTLAGCESMLVSETLVDESDLGPCAAAPLELRGNTVSRSILRGQVFALNTRVGQSVVGAQLGSSLSLFDSQVLSSLLCSVGSFAARGGSVVACARCAAGAPAAACIDQSSAISVVACPDLTDAEPCQQALPDSLKAELSIEQQAP